MKKFSIYAILAGISVSAMKLYGTGDDMIAAKDNKALPPFTTTDTVAAMKGKSLFEQTAAASKTGYPVRGEKNW